MRAMLLRYALSALASAYSVLAADTDTEPTSTTTVRVKSIVTVDSFVTVSSGGIATSTSATSTNGLGDFIMEGLGGGGGGGGDTSSSSPQALPASATTAPFPTKNATAAVDWQACQSSQVSWSDGWTSAFQPETVTETGTTAYNTEVITVNVTFGHADVYTTINGIPHAHGEIEATSVSQFVGPHSQAYSYTATHISSLNATYLEPSPNCTIAPSKCTALWQSYFGEQGMPMTIENATEPAITPMPTSRPRCSLGPGSRVCDTTGTSACIFEARKVDVFYWPQVTAAPNASLAVGNSSAAATQVVGNITMTSPSVYLIFDHLQAIYSIDGNQDCSYTTPLGATVTEQYAVGGAPYTRKVGGPYTDAVVSLDPSGLTSLVRDLGPVNTASVVSEIAHGGPSYSQWINHVLGSRINYDDPYRTEVLAKPVDYANFQVPDAEAYYLNINGAPGCNRIGDHPQCSTIFDGAYRAQLLVPNEVRALRSDWAGCYDPLYGALDPPIALTPAASIKAPSKAPQPTPDSPKDTPAKETPVDNEPKEGTPAIPGPTLPAEPSPTSSPPDNSLDAPENPTSDDEPSSNEPVSNNPPAFDDKTDSDDKPASNGTPPSDNESDPSEQPPSDDSSTPNDKPTQGDSSDTPSQDPGSNDAETPTQENRPSSPSNGQNDTPGDDNSGDSAESGPESNAQPITNDGSASDKGQTSNDSPGSASNDPGSNDADRPADNNQSQDPSGDQNNESSGESPSGNAEDGSSPGSGNGQLSGGTSNNGESSSESSGSNDQGSVSGDKSNDGTSDSKPPENALDVLTAAQQEIEAKQTASPSAGDAGNGNDGADDSADAGALRGSNGGSSSSSSDDPSEDPTDGPNSSKGGSSDDSTKDSSGDTQSASNNGESSNDGNNSDDATTPGSNFENGQSSEDDDGNSPSQTNDEPAEQVVDVDGSRHTVAASGGVPVIDGISLPADASHTTINGQAVSIGDEGVVVGTQTVQLPKEQPTSQEAIFIANGQRFTAAPGNSDGVAVIDGTTLTVGDSATVANGVSVSAASNGIVLDGSTTMTYSDAQAPERSVELTLGSSTATASQVSSSVFAIGSVTLTAGGSDATISGHIVSAASTGVVVDGESEAETGTGTGSETTQDTQATQSSGSDGQSSDPATSENGASSLGAARWAMPFGLAMLVMI